MAEGQRAIKAEDQFYAWLRNIPARLSKPLTIPLGSDLLRAVEMVKEMKEREKIPRFSELKPINLIFIPKHPGIATGNGELPVIP